MGEQPTVAMPRQWSAQAALRRIADLGGSAHQIKAIGGQELLSEVQNYTKAADQRRLAKSAMAMLEHGASTDDKQAE
jgi:hypothetical protein